MSQADQIRKAAIEKYILPARAAGQQDVVIRAGDLHREMGLTNAMPAICSALRSRKFEIFAGVRQLDATGPANGANVYFRFNLVSRFEKQVQTSSVLHENEWHSAVREAPPNAEGLDLSGAVVLVSCVKSKLSKPALARSLYCSDWFGKVRRIVEAQDARWFVLSALYGLVPPDREIAPYEHSLNTTGTAARRAWAADVYRELLPELSGYNRVVFFAGLRYREFLIGPLQSNGWQVEVPMEGLAIGEQLAWLSARQ